MNEFSKARLTLFGWYILISFVLLSVFTMVSFQAEKQSFNQIDQMLSNKIRRPVVSALLEKRLSKFSGDFRERLLYFDVVLFFVAAGASWLLSGITLKPIEEMVKKQQEFSADASHELRTPLTFIIMELETIKRTQKRIPKGLISSLENIKVEAIRMKHLVNNLLTLVRNEPYKKAGFEFFLLNFVAKEVFDSLANQAIKNELEYIFLDDKKLMVHGKSEEIRQVFTIILENAIKFTQSGRVTMKLSHDQNLAHIEVADTGIGIPSDDISHIFERFYRVHTRTKIHGSGLGLAIAKKIIDHHNGKLTVESTLDVGSIFTISLPLSS